MSYPYNTSSNQLNSSGIGSNLTTGRDATRLFLSRRDLSSTGPVWTTNTSQSTAASAANAQQSSVATLDLTANHPHTLNHHHRHHQTGVSGGGSVVGGIGHQQPPQIADLISYPCLISDVTTSHPNPLCSCLSCIRVRAALSATGHHMSNHHIALPHLNHQHPQHHHHNQQQHYSPTADPTLPLEHTYESIRDTVYMSNYYHHGLGGMTCDPVSRLKSTSSLYMAGSGVGSDSVGDSPRKKMPVSGGSDSSNNSAFSNVLFGGSKRPTMSFGGNSRTMAAGLTDARGRPTRRWRVLLCGHCTS